MKQKKTAAALALALCLTTPAYAAGGPFPDVPPDIWYAGAVDYCLERGLMGGADGLFRPSDTMTRAMLAQVLYSASGSPAPPAPPRQTARGLSPMCRRRPGTPAPPSGPLKPG